MTNCYYLRHTQIDINVCHHATTFWPLGIKFFSQLWVWLDLQKKNGDETKKKMTSKKKWRWHNCNVTLPFSFRVQMHFTMHRVTFIRFWRRSITHRLYWVIFIINTLLVYKRTLLTLPSNLIMVSATSLQSQDSPDFFFTDFFLIFGHTFAYARWAHMHCFLSVCPSFHQNLD